MQYKKKFSTVEINQSITFFFYLNLVTGKHEMGKISSQVFKTIWRESRG